MSEKSENEQIERAMVIVAHPDDPEFFCGGTMALWADQGVEITYVIITDGDKGSKDPEMTHERLTVLRKKEQRQAADVLGVKNIVFLGYPDGELFSTLELRQELVEEIRRYKPDVIVTSDPTRRPSLSHPDHLAAGEATMGAVYPAAGNRMYFPELLAQGLEPHTPREIYLSGTQEPDVIVDIDSVLERKAEALKRHESQVDPKRIEERFSRNNKDANGDQEPSDFSEKYKRLVLRR